MHERKYMHGCRYALNGTEATLDGSQCLAFMYGQALGWSYVITPGRQRFGNQQPLECRHGQERILIPCCICSWHARDIPTRPETNTRRVLHMYKNARNHNHRMRSTNWWFLHHCILSFMHILEQSRASRDYRGVLKYLSWVHGFRGTHDCEYKYSWLWVQRGHSTRQA